MTENVLRVIMKKNSLYS